MSWKVGGNGKQIHLQIKREFVAKSRNKNYRYADRSKHHSIMDFVPSIEDAIKYRRGQANRLLFTLYLSL